MKKQKEKPLCFSRPKPVKGTFLVVVFFLIFFHLAKAQRIISSPLNEGSFDLVDNNVGVGKNVQRFSTSWIDNSRIIQTDYDSQLLQMIFLDLVQKSVFSSDRVLILNTYPMLANQNNSRVGQVSFEIVDKAEWLVENGNTITFWRMDVSTNQAHFEFYLSFTDTQSVKFEYKFEKIGNEWKINVQRA